MVYAMPRPVSVRAIPVLAVLHVSLAAQLDDHLMQANFPMAVELALLLDWPTVLAVAMGFALPRQMVKRVVNVKMACPGKHVM